MSTAIVELALRDFNRGTALFTHLADDVVVEFPYGPTLGLPERIDGIDAVREHLTRVQDGGLTVHDPIVHATGSSRVVAEYIGRYRGAGDESTDIALISVIEASPDGITRMREYWDTHAIVVLNAAADSGASSRSGGHQY